MMTVLYLCNGEAPCSGKYDENSPCYINHQNEPDAWCRHVADARFAKHKNLTMLDLDRFMPDGHHLWEVPSRSLRFAKTT